LLDVLLRDAELVNKLQLQRNNNGSTPLIVAAAAAGEQPAVFSALLAVAGADVLEARTKQGEPLVGEMHAAGRTGCRCA
jgi:hypothetical protein